MSFQDLEKLTHQAIFRTPRQKTALREALPKLSDEQRAKLKTFLTETPQKLGQLVAEQDQKRAALLNQFKEDLKTVEHHATHEVWQEVETLDKNKEEAALDNLLKKL